MYQNPLITAIVLLCLTGTASAQGQPKFSIPGKEIPLGSNQMPPANTPGSPVWQGGVLAQLPAAGSGAAALVSNTQARLELLERKLELLSKRLEELEKKK